MLKSLFGHKHSHDDKCRHGKEESMFDDGTKSDNNDDCETIPLTHSLEQENINNLDLFQLAQRGLKEDFIFELQRSGNNPDLLDNEACSSLHWAAINNRIEVALYLISVKATVDIRGGQLSATPLHWAARAGHIHMVTILLKNGADPTLFDGQGYNALHLAAHAGHHLLMLYLNAIGMDWNTPDSASRTCLHWVAYQGNSLDSLKSLLKHNVGLDFLDNSGYTALHWSVIANHLDFSYELVKAGCNIDVKDGQGKTALDWAKERNTDEKFQKMLNDYYKETIKNSLPKKRINLILKICWCLPYFMLGFFIYTISTLDWYISFPVSLAVLSLIHNYIFMGYLLGNGQIKPVHTPYLTSIPQATIFYCVLDWMTMINDSGMMIENILMCILSAVLIYSFYKSVVLNPGYLKLNLSQTEKQAVIIRLAENGNLDARHYCLTCEVGKPLRSKHCKICDKCVAKFDHHCPWTYNCIGASNHRMFVVFLFSMSCSAWLYAYIASSYFSENAPNLTPAELLRCKIPQYFCTLTNFSTRKFFLIIWASINATWITFLLCSQVFQIFIAKTTNEFINYLRFDYMFHPNDLSLPVYKRRLVNNFDKGNWFRNCLDFWGLQSDEEKLDWFTLMNVPEFLEKKIIEEHGS